MTLKADWTKTYTVTYTLGGAEGAAPAAVTVKMGEKVSLPSAPAVDGQEFMGWKVGETTKAAGEEVEVTEDLTVTALWNKLCDVTYSLGEFEGYVPAAEVVDFGTELTLPAAPAVKGYTFKGWKVGDAVKAAGSKITVETDLAITATYEINTYTVNYYGYYGELLESEKVTYGEAAKYDGTPEGSGNIFVGFLGWSETEALKAVDRDMDVYSLWGYPQSDDKYFTFVESGDGYLVQAADDIADAFDGSVIYLPAEHNGKVVKGIVSFEENDELQSGAFANLPASTVVIPCLIRRSAIMLSIKIRISKPYCLTEKGLPLSETTRFTIPKTFRTSRSPLRWKRLIPMRLRTPDLSRTTLRARGTIFPN